MEEELKQYALQLKLQNPGITQEELTDKVIQFKNTLNVKTEPAETKVGFQKKAKVFSAAFQALAGVAEDTETGKNIARAVKSPVSLLKSGYQFFGENLAEAFVGTTETLLNIRSQQLVESDKITKEQRNQLLDASAEEFFDPILDFTRGAGDVFESADEAINKVVYEDPTTTASEDLLSGKIVEGSEKIADGVIEAIPSVVAALYGGPIGYATIFSSASGGAYKNKIDVEPNKRGDAGTFGLALAQGGVELASETITRGIIKGFGGTALEKVAPSAAKKLYKNLTKTLVGRVFVGANLEGASEVGAQETNRYLDALWDSNNAFGYRNEEAFKKGQFEYDFGNIVYRGLDTYMISAIIGGGLASASKTPSSKAYVEERLSPIVNKDKNLKIVNKISKLEQEYSKSPNDLILDEILELQKEVTDNKTLNEKVLNSFTDAELSEYTKGKVKIEEAKQGLKNITDTETRDIIENKIAKEESNLDNIYNDKLGAVKKSIGFAKSAEQIGLKTKAFEDTASFEKAIEQNGIKLDDQQKSELNEIGAFIFGSDIYINQEVAAETEQFNVGGHEVMHGIIYQKLNSLSEKELSELQNNFKNILSPQEQQLLQEELDNRYDKKDHSKEFFTVFSDLSQAKKINYNENLFTKIKDWLTEMVRRFTPYKKVKFNNAQDVYTFMRQYSTNIDKGTLSKGLAKGIGKVSTTEIATSKAASDNVQNIYNEKGVDGSFDIIEQFNTIISKQVDKRREAPNFNKQDLTDEIKYSNRGVLGLIRSYNPDSGVPLAAYINKFLPSRMIEASQKILGEEFTVDVTEAKGIAAQESEAIASEPLTKKIKPSSLLKNIESAKSKIVEGIKNIPEKNLTFKKLKDLSPETTAEIFEVPPKKVTDPKANLNKSDLSNAARNINKNADKLLRLLPKGAVVEAASEKLLGTSTGVSKSLLDVFYTKQERLTKGAGLSPYKLNSINRQQFLEGLGIVDGKLKEGLSPRSPEAQRIKGIMNLTGKLITNEIVRSEADLSLEVKQDIAAGKADIMFSKSVTRQKEEYADRTKSFNQFQIRNGKKVSKIDPNLKNEIKETIVPKLKKLPKDIKVSLLYTMQGTGKDKIDGTLGRSGMIYPNIASARDALGLSEIDVKEITSQPDFKDSMQYAGKSVLSTSQLSIETINKILTDTNLQKTIARENQAKLNRLNNIIKELVNLVAKKPELADGINHILGLQSDYQGHFIRKYVPFVSFTSPKILGNKKIHDEHYSKSLRTTRFTQSIIKKAALAGEIYIKNELNDDLENLNAGMARGIVSKVEGNRFDEKKGIGEQSFISETPFVEVYTKLENPKLHFVLPFTKLNPTSEIKSLQEIAEANFKLTNKNNKLLPPKEKISFSKKKPIDNKEVINKLKETDKANNQKIKEETEAVDLNKDFNDIIENKTGIGSEKRYAKAKAEVAGKDKGSFDYIGIPPSAQDFMGLMYKMIGKGKKGDVQLAWFKKNLLDPFAKGMIDISNARVALANDFKQIKKIANIAPKVLKNKLPGEPFTIEQAIRVYIWNKQDMSIDGLSQADLKTLTNYVSNNTNLLSFADQLIQINKDMAYPKPDKNWLMGTMTTDLLQGLNTTTRKEALSQWQSNVDIIFDEANMNKLEAAFGKNYRYALDNMLQRMKTGKNKGYPGDQLTGRFVDWLNGSVGAIMFFNMRSAVLQTISSVNFINFTDNNPLKAAAAFANQPQFWKDVMFIMNSDYLVERRNGLKINVNEADIAEIAAESKNKAKAFVNKLLKLGFLPTQIADSFAIATGGASFYRNRVKSYVKEGLSEKEAQDKAFLDFREITEENQQSSRPDRISQQQAGPLGRIILAFANTPAQYARIIQRAASDLKNGRGDTKTNISKIIYYGAVQNVIFNAMQQALFAIAFGDEEADDEKEAEKYGNIVNGMIDSLLRGTGFAGAAVSTVKNAILKIAKDGNKQDIAIDLINISPPISSKIRKIRSAGRTFDWNKKEIAEKGLSLDNPAYMAIGQLVSATTNVPLDRGIRKLTNIKDALDSENEEWMRIANALGWQKWELEWKKPKKKKKKKKSSMKILKF